MDKWLILHDHSRFSVILKQVLGKKAISVDIDSLVNDVQVRVNLDQAIDHSWLVSEKVVDDFCQRIIFQEVFFSVDSALYQYAVQDAQYVKYSWQAYLLSLFSYAKTVINPVTPYNLSISYYQFPRLLMIAEKVGFQVPRYEVGREKREDYYLVDSLWFWPGKECKKGIMNVEIIRGLSKMIRFVRYDDSYIVCWPEVPFEIKAKILKMCNELHVYIGEIYFKVGAKWCFYGLRPQIQTTDCKDEVLFEMAECLRDIGNEEIVQ